MIFLLCVVLGFAMTGGTWLATNDGVSVFVAFLVWIAAIWVLFMVLSVIAKRQVDYLVAASEEAVVHAIRGSFGALWRETSGPGTLNFRSRGPGIGIRSPGKQPVMSITIQTTPDAVEVSEWMSIWFSQNGMVLAIDRFAFQRLRVRRSLAGISPISEPSASF